MNDEHTVISDGRGEKRHKYPYADHSLVSCVISVFVLFLCCGLVADAPSVNFRVQLTLTPPSPITSDRQQTKNAEKRNLNHEVRHRPPPSGPHRHHHSVHRHAPPINTFHTRFPCNERLIIPRHARTSLRPPRQNGKPQSPCRYLLSQTHSQGAAGQFAVEEVLFG